MLEPSDAVGPDSARRQAAAADIGSPASRVGARGTENGDGSHLSWEVLGSESSPAATSLPKTAAERVSEIKKLIGGENAMGRATAFSTT